MAAVETAVRRIIELDVKTAAGALRAIEQQTKALAALEKTASGVVGSLKGFAGGFIAAFAGGFTATALKHAMEAMSATKDAAEQLGMTIPLLQQWRYAAEFSGASAEDLAAGVRGLAKSMDAMSGPAAASTKALQYFGVKAGDSVDAALTKIAEGFAQMKDGPQKVALALDLFGKTGYKLIPMLNKGAEGIAAMKEEAIKLGIAFSDKAGAGAQAFTDDLNKLKRIFDGTVYQLIEGMLPALQNISTAFVETGKQGNGLAGVGRIIGSVLEEVAGYAIKGVTTLRSFTRLVQGLKELWSEQATEGPSKALKKALDDINRWDAQANKTLADMRLRSAQARLRALVEGAGGTITGLGDEQPKGPEKPNKVPDFGAKTDKDVEALERFIKAQQDAIAGTKEMNAEQQLAYEISSGNIKVTTDQERALLKKAEALAHDATMQTETNGVTEEAIRLMKEAEQPHLEEIKHLDQLREGYLDLIDPARAFKREMEELDKVIAATTDSQTRELLKAYKLSLEVSKQAGETWNKMLENQKNNAQQIADEIKGYAGKVADTLVDFASGVEASFGDMVRSILSSMAKLLVQQQLQPMMDAFATWASSAKGNVFGPSGVQAFASGGVVSSPTFFGMAGGGVGLMGEAGPEAVVPLKRTSGGDLGVQASPVHVTIVNNTPAQVKTEEARSSNGERELRVMIDNAVTEGMGSGRYDRVMSTTYGVTRRGR